MIDDQNGLILEEIVIKPTTTSTPPNLVSANLNNNSIIAIVISCGILTVTLLVFIAYICKRHTVPT